MKAAVLATVLCLGLLAFGQEDAYGQCRILTSQGTAATGNADALAQLLSRERACPRDVFELRALLKRAGADLQPTFVANRGFHNPGRGSFSVFEMVSGRLDGGQLTLGRGEMFFGHFTAPGPGQMLVLDQSGGLMVELIAWDEPKGMFNFYELIGNGQQRRWFYRGDSADIVADTAGLHRRDGPQFGERLRCSGCHVMGGPIMKELTPPHNDWWRSDRRLPLGGRQPDPALAAILDTLVEPGELAQSVQTGLQKLEESRRFRALRGGLSFQERLRPLFCPMELNLASDSQPLDSGAVSVNIPSELMIDPLFAVGAVAVARQHYQQALTRNKARFPETARPDADHAWLTPVKAHADLRAIRAMIGEGTIDEEFAGDVLAVDRTNPVFSNIRCGLLRLVPETQSRTWLEAFKDALSRNGGAGGAELVANLTQPGLTLSAHKQRADALLRACRANLTTAEAVEGMLRLLATRRAEAFASPISSSPQGQILEPGFRVIFPTLSPPASPGRLKLTDDCKVVPAK
jgi:hypothetical protein